MTNLLKVELKTLFGKSISKISIVLAIALGIFFGLMNMLNEELSCAGVFEYTLMLLAYLPAIPGFYLSKDYTNNTIRNKIVVGNKRIDIYFSKLIAVIIFCFLCTILFLSMSIISNIIFIGTKGINIEALIYGIILTLFGVISIASITTLISMSIKSEAGGLAPVMIIYLTLMFYIVGMEFLDENIMNVLNNLFSIGQVMTLNAFEVPKDILFKILCMIGQVIVSSSLGYAIFRKTDLK